MRAITKKKTMLASCFFRIRPINNWVETAESGALYSYIIYNFSQYLYLVLHQNLLFYLFKSKIRSSEKSVYEKEKKAVHSNLIFKIENRELGKEE